MSSDDQLRAYVQQLEQRVQALEAATDPSALATGKPVGVDESLQPTYLTINAAGQVSASFTGFVNALGLLIPANTTGIPYTTNEIAWVDATNRVLTQMVTIHNPPPPEGITLQIQSVALDAGDSNDIALFTQDKAAQWSAELHVEQDASLEALVGGQIVAGGVGFPFTIADIASGGTGLRSSFLQLAAGSAQVAVAYGSFTFTWPGGSGGPGGQTITHGLGRTPQVVLMTSTWTTGAFNVICSLGGAPGATTFNAEGWCPQGNPPLNNTSTVYWIAIG